MPAKKRAIMVPGPEKLDFWHFRLLRKEFSVFPYSLPLPNGGRRIPIWHPSQVLKHPTQLFGYWIICVDLRCVQHVVAGSVLSHFSPVGGS